MPQEIDRAARLDEIAQATLDVAASRGIEGATIRAIAARMGGSTTLVTKFVATRAALLANVFDFIQRTWEAEVRDEVGSASGKDRLVGLIRWGTQTSRNDRNIRRLWLQALAQDDLVEQRRFARTIARKDHKRLLEAAREADLDDWVADVIFLALCGYHVSNLEDPKGWTTAKAATAMERLVAAVTESA